MLRSVTPSEPRARLRPACGGRRPRGSAGAVVQAALAGALLLAGGAEAAPDDNTLTFDVIFGDNSGGRVPSDLAWSPDGRSLAYVWDDGNGKALWRLDVTGGQRRVLVREGGDGGLELSAYHWSPGSDAVLVESAGDLYLVDAAGGAPPRRLTDTAEEESDPKFSPDGGAIAFVRDFDLWRLELATGDEAALTTGGARNEILNGVTDWVYWEEIWGRDSTGYWWSPGGDRIAYYRFDEAPVGTYPLVDYTAVPYPIVEEQKYPKAGTANPIVRVGVRPAGGAESGEEATVWLDTRHEPDDYLVRVDWLPSGERVAVQRLNREQDTLELLSCSAADGRCALLLKETWPTWVNLHQDLRFLADGRFLWSSEKSSWRRLYLHDAAGAELAALTPEGWAVTSLDAADEAAGTFIYTAYAGAGLGAKDRLVFLGRLDGGPPEVISSAEGWHSANVAEATGNRVHTWSDANHPARQMVLGANGNPLAELPSEPPPFDPDALPAWRFFTIAGADGVRLPAAMLEAAPVAGAGDPATARPPAIMYHYGGPASQVVANRWGSRGRGLWHKMMAQRGYAVLTVDNPGSNYFGKRGEDRLHRRFGEINLAAQLAGAAYLKGLDSVDPAKIGLWGWSGGGSNTLYSILNSPGTWAAAMSGAPVTDWRLYDTIWTERYLDHPEDNPDGYRDSSAVTWADKLATPLLVVHGTGDDNVHPQNTLALVHRLIEAGKPVETAIYPRQKHGLRGISSRHFYERMTEFFERHLTTTPGAPE